MSDYYFPKFNKNKKINTFDLMYFSDMYKSDLDYLFKIVHNKDMLDELTNDKNMYDNFCLFVWNVINKNIDIKKTKTNLEEKQINEMLYLFNFLKEYDSIYLFKNLSLSI